MFGLSDLCYRSTNFSSNGGEFSGFGLSLHSAEVSISCIVKLSSVGTIGMANTSFDGEKIALLGF